MSETSAAPIAARRCAPQPIAPPALLVAPYDAARDYPRAAAWWRAHGAPVIAARWLPREGFMASLPDGPCAAVWLYRMEGVPLGMIDNLVVAPGLAPRAAARAARAVIGAALDAAHAAGLDAVISSTEARGVARLCVRGGWSARGAWVLVRATGHADRSAAQGGE